MYHDDEKYIVQTRELPIHNDDVEEMVKKHLNIVVISMIRNNSMSGQDIAKEIFYKYHVYMSPSAIYSILYSLKNQGMLEIDTVKGDLRTKYYVPTEKGRQVIDKRLNEFKETLEYLVTCINKRLT
ncbi:MAG: PadR family transcriptional regulator [Candidatus Cloacimonetes bacterium]|nr:PadR family transcriptional regulator [Candidatus Cloacimonadota bacterium]